MEPPQMNLNDDMPVYRPRIQRHIVSNLRLLFPEFSDKDDEYIVQTAVILYHDARIEEIKKIKGQLDR